MKNIRDILDKTNTPYVEEGEHHHSRLGWLQINCPFCGIGGDSFHMGYNLENSYFNCWKCGPRSVAEVFRRVTGLSWDKCRELARGISKELADYKPPGTLKIPGGLCELKGEHIKYLQRRKFKSSKLIRLWKLQGTCGHPRIPWSLFIPIYYRNQIVNWTTRSLKDTGRRYLAASDEESGVLKGNLLYGYDYCRNSVIIHEGHTDVWRTGPGSVATGGTGFTTAQVQLLAKIPVRAVCFDSEPVAQVRAKKLAQQLSLFPGETHLVVLDADDPGSASLKETKLLRKAFL